MPTPQDEEKLRLIKIGRFYSDPRVQAKLQEQLDASWIGERVREGARKPRNRKHELHDLIECTFTALAADGCEPSTEDVLAAIEAKTYDTEDIVQEVNGNFIYWRDSRYREHKMKVSTLRNWLTKIRKCSSQS